MTSSWLNWYWLTLFWSPVQQWIRKQTILAPCMAPPCGTQLSSCVREGSDCEFKRSEQTTNYMESSLPPSGELVAQDSTCLGMLCLQTAAKNQNSVSVSFFISFARVSYGSAKWTIWVKSGKGTGTGYLFFKSTITLGSTLIKQLPNLYFWKPFIIHVKEPAYQLSHIKTFTSKNSQNILHKSGAHSFIFDWH